MASSVSSPVVRLSSGSPAEVDTDLLVVPVFDGEAVAEALPAVDAATGGEVARAAASGEIKGRLYEIFVTPSSGSGWKPARVAIVGRREGGGFHDRTPAQGGDGGGADGARRRRIPRVAFLAARADSGARGRAGDHRGADSRRVQRGQVQDGRALRARRDGADGGRAQAGVRRRRGARSGGSARARFSATPAISRARFANEPSNVLTPRVFAERASGDREGGGRRRGGSRRERRSRRSAWVCCSASRAAAPSRRA